jgi:hypothetical protein
MRPGAQAFRIVEQNLQDMVRRELRMALAHGERLGDCTKPRARSVYFSKFMDHPSSAAVLS